jgi:hypothetical protein
MPYSIAVSKLRYRFLSDFLIAVRLLRRREQFTEPDFALLARAFSRARALHPFYHECAGMSADESVSPSVDGSGDRRTV